jgi:hypothetical protein
MIPWDEDPNHSRPLVGLILCIVAIGSPVVIGLTIWRKDWELFLLWFGVLLALVLPQLIMGLVAWSVAHLWYRVRDRRTSQKNTTAKGNEP